MLSMLLCIILTLFDYTESLHEWRTAKFKYTTNKQHSIFPLWKYVGYLLHRSRPVYSTTLLVDGILDNDYFLFHISLPYLQCRDPASSVASHLIGMALCI